MKALHNSMLDPVLFWRTFGGRAFAAWPTVSKVLDSLPRQCE